VFDWDEHNSGHVTESGIEPEEAEEALLAPQRIGAPAYNAGDERRWAALGTTADGRILFVVFTRRQGLIRVVTARNTTEREKRRYRAKGK
jgi:uncharacterized DUF497 family protein